MPSVKNRLAATLAASAVLLGSIAALGSSPASAAPGDASARGIDVGLTVNLLGQPAVGLNSGIGAVSAPPAASQTWVDTRIGGGVVAVDAGVVSIEANSDATNVDGRAEVTNAVVSVPVIDDLIGGPILGTGTSVISAAADCAPGTDPSTSFGDTATLVVAGQPVTLDVNGEATVSVTLPTGTIGSVAIRTDVSNVDADSAEATALIVDINIDVIGVASVVGEVRIAEAACERALPVVDENPSILTISPNEGPVAGGQTVTITGTNFVDDGTQVVVDGAVVPAGDVTVVSSTELTYVTPPHAVGPVGVSVTTPAGDSEPLTYTYVDDGTDGVPSIDSIDPDEGPVAGGTDVTLTGSDFVPGETTITIGGIEIPAGDVEVGGDGVTATFTTPPHAAGPVDVTATTGAGTSTPQTFTYIGDSGSEAPVAETIDPAEGPVEGGTVVVIDGSGFVPGETTVTIDDQTIPADEVIVNDDGTTVTFTTPPHVAGPVDVVVSTPNGDSGVLVFTYVEGDTGGPVDPTDPGTTPPVDNGTNDPLYDNCDEVFAAGLSDLTPSDPGYGTHLDRDGDGVACEATGNGGPGGPGNGGNNGNSNNGSLPRTGAESVPLVAGGLLTILVGGAVLAARRRLA